MSKFTAFVIIVALRLIFHPSNAHTAMDPFAGTSPNGSTNLASTISIAQAKPIQITRNINNMIRQWREWLNCENHIHPFNYDEETSNERLYLVSNKSTKTPNRSFFNY